MGKRSPRGHSHERGSVLVAAMMVMGVVMSLTLLIITVSISTGKTSGHDRQRLVAVDAAEAGVDAAYASIQSSGVSLPCSWPASGSTDVKTYPDTASVKATMQYYSGSTPLTCVSGVLPAGSTPTRAVISSVGTTGELSGRAGERKMEALVNLIPQSSGRLDKPIVGDTGITLSQAATINGNVGSDADLYTSGNYTCTSSPIIKGSIYAPYGSITMDQTCTSTADVWARDAVTLTGNKTIGGRVLSSQSSINAASNTNVNGTLIAKGNITWPGCTASKCLKNQSAVPPPPEQSFPKLRGDDATLAAWTAQGYQVIAQPAGVACGSATGDWIKANAPTLSQKTLLRTSCAVTFASTNAITFGKDFALFAYGGISTTNLVSFTASEPRNINMVVPFDAQAPACTSPTVNVGNNFSSPSNVTLLWYSPCDITYANGGGSYGAVYSGSQLISGNAFTLNFKPIQLYGVDPTSQAPVSFKLDIVYKREDRVS
ncbi:MAG: pilus assembly PilX family protein [Actinomycetes bacterium]